MKTLALLLPDRYFTSSVTGLVDLLHIANGCWGREKPPLFRWLLLSETGERAVSASGLSLGVDGDYSRADEADVIYLPGVGYRDLAEYERRLAAGRDLCLRIAGWHRQGRLIAANCTGVAWLAQSGVLDGVEATVSWWLTDWFRGRYPAVKLKAHALLVDAGTLLTSGASTSHYRLGLSLVERHAGADLALMVARLMLVDIQRESQAPFASFQQYFGHGDALVARSQQWLQQRLAETFRLAALACAVGTSERTLIRRFRSALGDTPLRYLQRLRLHAACRLLETSSLSLERIVPEVGYADLAAFRRLFRRELGCTPAEFRRTRQN